MGYFELIVGAIKEFFGSFKFFDKWFTKTPTEKVDDRIEEIDELEEEFRKNGGRNGKK